MNAGMGEFVDALVARASKMAEADPQLLDLQDVKEYFAKQLLCKLFVFGKGTEWSRLQGLQVPYWLVATAFRLQGQVEVIGKENFPYGSLFTGSEGTSYQCGDYSLINKMVGIDRRTIKLVRRVPGLSDEVIVDWGYSF